MKERFESRLLTGNLNVVCKFQDGSVRTWKADKEEVIKNIISIVDRYEDLGYRLTLRQLHYQFVGHVPGYVNHDTAYKKLGRILDDCRYAGIIDWDRIVDRGRKPVINRTVTGIPDALEQTANSYCLNRQRGQEVHVEVWTEKDALSEIFWNTASKYGLRMSINKGNISTSALYDAYVRFCHYIENGQEVVILYFGDHDPSGLDMVRDIEERLRFMFSNGDRYTLAGDSFNLIPIGLTKEQIKKYKLPPNPVKMTDSRSNGYIKKHGKKCWEVDALSPEVLTQILESNIEDQIDIEQFGKMVKLENKEENQLRKLIKTFI